MEGRVRDSSESQPANAPSFTEAYAGTEISFAVASTTPEIVQPAAEEVKRKFFISSETRVRASSVTSRSGIV